MDTDGDGLVDAQEVVLGTSIVSPDSDNDGYSDLEELARKTSPGSAAMHPDPGLPSDLSLGMSCYGASGMVHAVIALYIGDHNVSNKSLHVGFLIGNRIVDIPTDMLASRANVHTYPAHDPNAVIAVVDMPFSPGLVNRPGGLTVFATAGVTGSGILTTADSAHLFDIGGVITLLKITPNAMAFTSMGTGQTHNNGAIYVPLSLGGGGEPTDWTTGAICFQETEDVGSRGAVVTQEVVSAQCLDGWDGSCPPSCSSSVGTTYTTLDPVILIGG